MSRHITRVCRQTPHDAELTACSGCACPCHPAQGPRLVPAPANFRELVRREIARRRATSEEDTPDA